MAGWIGLAGPYDFLPIKNPDAQSVFHHPDTPLDSQPVGFAGASTIPAFLGAASEDADVNPQRNTGQLARMLQAAGAPARCAGTRVQATPR